MHTLGYKSPLQICVSGEGSLEGGVINSGRLIGLGHRIISIYDTI
jgi:hypothetical protein